MLFTSIGMVCIRFLKFIEAKFVPSEMNLQKSRACWSFSSPFIEKETVTATTDLKILNLNINYHVCTPLPLVHFDLILTNLSYSTRRVFLCQRLFFLNEASSLF
jgi:hypothetical protein